MKKVENHWYGRLKLEIDFGFVAITHILPQISTENRKLIAFYFSRGSYT